MGNSPSPHDADRSPLRLDRQNPYLRIHAVNIFVRDQDRSLEFYRDQLGFDLAFDARLPSGAAGWPSLGKLAESSLVAIE